MSISEERVWDEQKATWSLTEAGALVAGYEREGITIPNREEYHERIVEAHTLKDVEAYRAALNGYVEAAMAAYRRAHGLK